MPARVRLAGAGGGEVLGQQRLRRRAADRRTDAAARSPLRAARGAGTWLAAGGVTLIFWSGTTEATAGLAASVAASAGVTVAANDATAL